MGVNSLPKTVLGQYNSDQLTAQFSGLALPVIANK